MFLTDRNILADQAYLDFGAFDDDALVRITPKDITKRGEVPKNGSVFFTIFQSLMSGKNDEPQLMNGRAVCMIMHTMDRVCMLIDEQGYISIPDGKKMLGTYPADVERRKT